MPVFDPVVKNGLFGVSYLGKYKKYRAVDKYGAMWKMAKFLKVPFFDKMAVLEIEKTLRKSDLV